jgi:aspartyl-tRNA(Asn)/glutamyl-tRNA(Gln) amidotransferase subunit C
MDLSEDDVRRLALLARVAISDAEAGQVLGELRRIFTLIAELEAVDTGGIEPMSHAQEVTLHLRPDAVGEHDQREAFQRIAPQVEAGLYLVPRVIE